MQLEWDEAKRNWTLEVRGLDFASIADVNWDTAFTIVDDRGDYAEQRFITIAPLRDRLCVFVWCERGNATRIIILRKANDREKILWPSN